MIDRYGFGFVFSIIFKFPWESDFVGNGNLERECHARGGKLGIFFTEGSLSRKLQ